MGRRQRVHRLVPTHTRRALVTLQLLAVALPCTQAHQGHRHPCVAVCRGAARLGFLDNEASADVAVTCTWQGWRLATKVSVRHTKGLLVVCSGSVCLPPVLDQLSIRPPGLWHCVHSLCVCVCGAVCACLACKCTRCAVHPQLSGTSVDCFVGSVGNPSCPACPYIKPHCTVGLGRTACEHHQQSGIQYVCAG